MTGAHTVSDISCTRCGAVLGWKYVAAEDEAQRYKVGKFILETKKVCVAHCWEEQDDEEGHNVTEDVPAASKKNGHQKEIGLSKARNGTAGSKGSGATASPSGDGGVVSKDDGGNNGAIKDTAGPSNGMVIGRPRISDREKEKDRAAGEVQFDSQDEEECDDLFAGVWSPALANRRRSRRRFGRGE